MTITSADLRRLIEPYSDPDQSGKPRKTIEGQIAWLSKGKGLPLDIIQRAIVYVYGEMDKGKKFETGQLLDRYLLDTANRFHRERLAEQVTAMENQIQVAIDQHVTKIKTAYDEKLKTARAEFAAELEGVRQELTFERTRVKKMGYFKKIGLAIAGRMK